MSAGTDDSGAVGTLSERVAEMVSALVDSGEPVLPDRVVEVAAYALPHSHHAGLTLLRHDRPPVTVAASDDLPLRVDALQYALREGPCLDAAVGSTVRLSDDVGTDPRWPVFGPRCVRHTGAHSMLSLRLPVGGEDHAAINYYSREVGAFSQVDVEAATAIVPIAALAVEAHLRKVDHDNLMLALRSSRRISTAIGILMAAHHLSSDDAFEALRRTSMDLNTKLHDVADEVTLTGALPTSPFRRRPDSGQRPVRRGPT